MKTFDSYITEATKLSFTQNTLKNEFTPVLAPLLKKEFTYAQIGKMLEKLGVKYDYEVSVITNSDIPSGYFSIMGFYSIDTDEERELGETLDVPIELTLIFSPDAKTLSLETNGFNNFLNALTETILHEHIHMEQARSRNFIKQGSKNKYFHKVQNVEIGHYLANNDEIEAHAFNIAGAILDFTNRSLTASIRFLKSPKKKILADHSLDQYMDVFPSGHPVLKRLFKKIVIFLNNRIKE